MDLGPFYGAERLPTRNLLDLLSWQRLLAIARRAHPVALADQHPAATETQHLFVIHH